MTIPLDSGYNCGGPDAARVRGLRVHGRDICAGDLWTSLKDALDVMKVTCDELPPVV
ncbi:MAG: hypothetical protein GY854_31795 [Deltaproteobacteria bacterium]|nr:hypothetical protein [Deltaproteobacteria bacterium]